VEILGLSSPQTILVIEDKLSFAYRLIRWLEVQGHTVYGYAGVLKVEGSVMTGTNPLSVTSPDNLDLSTISVCFLDHYFEGEKFNGTTFTQVLAPLGVKVCGMSSVDPANQSMLRAGAICAYRKDILGRNLGI
jgi:hypothetical protein